MEFIVSLDTYATDQAAKNIWERFRVALGDTDGICYYKHPIISATTPTIPDLTILAHGYEPVAIRIIPRQLSEITHIEDRYWVYARDAKEESPLLEISDFIVGLQHKFDKERELRKVFNATGVIALPLIAHSDFHEKFGEFAVQDNIRFIWADLNIHEALIQREALKQRKWNLAKSIFQGINPINKRLSETVESSEKMGGAIKILEREIALLDEEQHKVAVQMAPGPQRIRGLAGTGKTVVLAMKAANIHLRYPERKILFTFNTQSLYNQAKSLITKFYRVNSDSDPDWEQLHVRHGWGSRNRPGVYSDLSRRQGKSPLTFRQAQTHDAETPFRACCAQVSIDQIEPIYDYILVDEAQDFPQEFFPILARLVMPEEKKIYWAYDELQSLSALEIPPAEDLFGRNQDGSPVISLDGENYPGDIEKDFVLHRSYRCPLQVLMLAHGIGLGIHAPRGCMQMLENRASWESIGYEIIQGELQTGELTIIRRPPINSPNRIGDIYRGKSAIVSLNTFDDREDELKWVASAIANDIRKENVEPEQIVVISLNSRVAKKYFTGIQSHLFQKGINSTIPGLINEAWEFAEPGMVTLSTVYRAKGNEAPIIYIISFDSLYGYAEEIENRNRAFTSISRSKGWVRITGSGARMADAASEIKKIMDGIPEFRFIFPNMDEVGRKLDAFETTRRRQEVRKAKKSMQDLLQVNKDALADLDPRAVARLRQLLNEVKGEDK